jgi:hypothetical protein
MKRISLIRLRKTDCLERAFYGYFFYSFGLPAAGRSVSGGGG